MDSFSLRRLAFIKGLYGLGRAQSENRGPLQVAAVLTFHDAAELWLRLASEVLNVPGDVDFMKYWETLSQRLPQELPGKERMRRLNKARVNLKHFGIMPSELDVHDLREATASFLQEGTALVFQRSFTELSLIDLIPDQDIAACLREVAADIDRGEIASAMDGMARGFLLLQQYLGEGLVKPPGRPPIHIVRHSRFWTYRYRDISRHMLEALGDIEREIVEVRARISVVELGVNVTRLRNFSVFVPKAVRMGDGKIRIQRYQGSPALEANEDEARECFDFLVDTSIMLADQMDPAVSAVDDVSQVRGPSEPS